MSIKGELRQSQFRSQPGHWSRCQKAIVKSEDALVMTAYSDLSPQYSLSVENCVRDEIKSIAKINWRNIDGTQGDEAEVVILDYNEIYRQLFIV